MFREELNSIVKESFEILNLKDPYIRFNNVANSAIHPALKTYLSAELDFLVYKDRVRLLSKSQFDYSGPVVHELFNQIGREVKENKKLSIDYVKKIIKFAVAFNFHFLTRPNETLRKFLFFEEKHKPIEEILTLLNYIYFYPYLKESLELYFQRKRLISINGEELSSILKKIDETVLETSGKTALNSAVDSMMELLSINDEHSEKIKLEFIYSFLDDKGYSGIKELVVQKFSQDQTEVKPAELKELFESSITELQSSEIPDEHPASLPIEEKDISRSEEVFETIEAEKVSEDHNDSDKMWEEITAAQQKESPDHLLEEISGDEEFEDDDFVAEEHVEDDKIEKNEEMFKDEIETDTGESVDDEPSTIEVELGKSKSKLSETDSNENELESDLDFLSEEGLRGGDENAEEFVEDETLEGEIIQGETKDEFQSPMEEKNKDEKEEELPVKNIEVSRLLENKQMPRIIEVVFDYDMEDFSNLLDNISLCGSAGEVEKLIDKHMESNHVDTSLKEVETLKSLILEQFGQK